jgi:hypothetical protein
MMSLASCLRDCALQAAMTILQALNGRFTSKADQKLIEGGKERPESGQRRIRR